MKISILIRIGLLTFLFTGINILTNAQALLLDQGTGPNDYVVNYPANFSGALPPAGIMFTFKVKTGNTNTGSSDLKLNAFGSLPILKNGNFPVQAGDIKSDAFVTVIFDGANWQMLSVGGNVVGTGNVTGIGTVGNIPFWNGSNSLGNDNNFFWDNTNKRLGIGTSTPNAPLQFSNAVSNRKIVLNETLNNDHQFYGFGVNGLTLRYQVDNTTADHIFFAGTSATTSNELMRIRGNGNVGIGITTPASIFHVRGTSPITLIDANAAAQQSSIVFAEIGATRWQLGKQTNNSFFIYDQANSRDALQITNSTNIILAPSVGNVGIGTTTPNAPLQFANISPQNRKIVLFDNNNNDHQFFGMGMNASMFRFQVDNSGSDFAFFNGTNATTSNEIMRIRGNGNVGIGTSNPDTRLSIFGGAMSIHAGIGNGANRPALNIVPIAGEITGTYVPGADFGYMRLSAGGYNSTTNKSYIDISGFSTIPDMDKNIVFGTSGQERMRIAPNGNIGIGIPLPNARLDIGGNGIGTIQAILARGNPDDNFQLQTLNGDGSGLMTRIALIYNPGINNASIDFYRGGSNNDGSIAFTTLNTDRLRINSNGRIGIGTINPTSTLQINGSISRSIVSTNTNLTLNETHYTVILTNNGLTITIPPAASCNGRVYVILSRPLVGGNNLSISYLDFDGASSTAIPNRNPITIQSDGTVWNRIQ